MVKSKAIMALATSSLVLGAMSGVQAAPVALNYESLGSGAAVRAEVLGDRMNQMIAARQTRVRPSQSPCGGGEDSCGGGGRPGGNRTRRGTNQSRISQATTNDDEESGITPPANTYYDQQRQRPHGTNYGDNQARFNQNGSTAPTPMDQDCQCYDQYGNPMGGDRYDQQGRPMKGGMYDKNGNLMKKGCYDRNGKPMNENSTNSTGQPKGGDWQTDGSLESNYKRHPNGNTTPEGGYGQTNGR